MQDINFASLSSRLLARKGGAKPSQRIGLGALAESGTVACNVDAASASEDADEAYSAEIDDASFAHINAEVVPITAAAEPVEVRRQQERIEASFAPAPASAAPRAARPRRSALDRGDKAAFTLRLDGDRHTRLRLACTAANRSAQQVVTEALDNYLAERPELAALADQLRRTSGS